MGDADGRVRAVNIRLDAQTMSATMNSMQTKNATVPGSWSTERILTVLGTRVAMNAMRGRAADEVTLRVIRTLEGK